MGLVLSRRLNEQVQIGPDLLLTVVEIERGNIRLHFEAPDGLEIWRKEVWDRMQAEAVAKPAPAPAQ